MKRKTPNAEHRTPNIEWIGSPWRVNDMNSEDAAPKKIKSLKKMNRDPRLVACLAEADELIRIFVASVRTTERRSP
jgi:hypothetical protein